MKRIIFRTLLICLICISIPHPTKAYDFQVNGLCYTKRTSSTLWVSQKYSDSRNKTYVSGSLIIPSKVTFNGTVYTPTAIDKMAFYGCSDLTSITIPSSINYIAPYCPFEDCSGLKTLNYNAVSCTGPSSSSDRWFIDCPLTSLTIGDSVKSIPAYLAYYQTGITSLTIPGSVTSIGDYAFRGCSGVKYFYCNALTPPTLGTNCFPSGAIIIT